MPTLLTGPGTMVRIRREDEKPSEPGNWLTARYATRDRMGVFMGNRQPVFNRGASNPRNYALYDRLLTNTQVWSVYKKTPDVRAAVDSIVRRVSTFDWFVEPTLQPADDNYDTSVALARAVKRRLEVPNVNGDTWQEMMTMLLTDLLVYDAAALELVKDAEGNLVELVPIKGSTIHPIVDDHGTLLYYEQDLYNDDALVTNEEGPTFQPDELVYLRLYPNTDSPEGMPIIETIVDQIITLMRSAQHAMLALDADEVPPGILVLTGIAGLAAKEARQDLENLKGKDHKIRVLTTPDPSGVGASWVELRHTPKDLEMRQIVQDIRRIVWRCFGVMPVEMGETEMMPRATAEVQVDVASSYLVTPILELIAAKINQRVLPVIIDDESLGGLITFGFDRTARLTPKEQKERAETHAKYVQMGLMTRNEARTELGLLPIPGGDVPTVDTPNGPVPFEFFMAHPSVAAPPQPVVPDTPAIGAPGTIADGEPVTPIGDEYGTEGDPNE